MVMLAGVVLLFSLGLASSASVSAGYPEGCRAYIPRDIERLVYSCTITSTNWASVLHYTKGLDIPFLTLMVDTDLTHFVFPNNSFSSHIVFLGIYGYHPFHFSSGAFAGMSNLYTLNITLLYNSHYRGGTIVNTGASIGQLTWASPMFYQGWLAPLSSLNTLSLSHNNISEFAKMEFCILKQLRTLDLSNNRIAGFEDLGIICTTSSPSCKPCLVNVTHLDISNNPLVILNVSIKDNVPRLQSLIMSNCSLAFLHLHLILTESIHKLDLSYNNLEAIFMEGLDNCNQSSLKILLLQNNKLEGIVHGLFICTKYLLHLNLAQNKLSKDSLTSAGLNDLTELTWLDLSYNNITSLQSRLIGNLTELVEFSCSGCRLQSIGTDTFTHMTKLKILKLDNNHLHVIKEESLAPFQRLQVLDLTSNFLRHLNLTKNLLTLVEVHLGDNLFSNIPDLSASGSILSILNLRGNNITKIHPHAFSGLTNLTWLSLASNHILKVPDYAFKTLNSLQVLHLNNNRIKTISYFGLDNLPELTHLRLDRNFLKVFIPLKDLTLQNLKILNLSSNFIRSIKTQFFISVEGLDLSWNQIAKVGIGFLQSPTLQYMNLTPNNLSTLNSLNLLTSTQPRPKIYLQGNPFHCDCNIEWILYTTYDMSYRDLLRFKISPGAPPEMWNSLRLRSRLPEVADLKSVICATSITGKNTHVSKMTIADFICPWRKVCYPSLCKKHCCSMPECPCRTFCYSDCQCLGNQYDDTMDMMNCSSRGITSLPSQGPTYARRIWLDGNNLISLNSSTLNFPLLKMLFMNNSHVCDIQVGALNNISALTFLDLHQNEIRGIREETFSDLTFLEKLYLQENKIDFIENLSFNSLQHLETIWLHGNNMEYLNLSLFDGMDSLRELTLHQNPWSCDCQFGPAFKKWAVTHANIIKNHTLIYCKIEIPSEQGAYVYNQSRQYSLNNAINRNNLVFHEALIHIDFAFCKNQTHLKSVEYRYIKSVSEVITLVVVFTVLVILVLVIHKNRLLLRVLMYNKYGLRFHDEEEDNIARPYDVFIAYIKSDERLVVRRMLPELENENMSYKVCLECRDWYPGAATTEATVASVQQSKRTILLVTKNHLDTQWCEFAFDAAHYQVMKDKHIQLILVLADIKLASRLTRTMKLYMKTNTFLVIGEKRFWKKLRYFLADNPRGADHVVGIEFGLMKA